MKKNYNMNDTDLPRSHYSPIAAALRYHTDRDTTGIMRFPRNETQSCTTACSRADAQSDIRRNSDR